MDIDVTVAVAVALAEELLEPEEELEADALAELV